MSKNFEKMELRHVMVVNIVTGKNKPIRKKYVLKKNEHPAVKDSWLDENPYVLDHDLKDELARVLKENKIKQERTEGSRNTGVKT